jgi:hypothetical protein
MLAMLSLHKGECTLPPPSITMILAALAHTLKFSAESLHWQGTAPRGRAESRLYERPMWAHLPAVGAASAAARARPDWTIEHESPVKARCSYRPLPVAPPTAADAAFLPLRRDYARAERGTYRRAAPKVVTGCPRNSRKICRFVGPRGLALGLLFPSSSLQ